MVEAQSPGGADRLRQLLPAVLPEEVERRQGLLGEVRRALDAGLENWPLAGTGALRPWLKQSRRAGARLEAPELLQVAETLRAARAMRAFLDAHTAELPQLLAATAALQAHPTLLAAIDAAILPTGELADAASPELARLRRQLGVQREAVLQALEKHLARSRGDAEAYVTVRGERFVIPVRADSGGVRGIVHDRSATGATLFVEPLDVVEANNELQALRDREAREVLRILADLTARLGQESDAVLASLEALEHLDALHAAARVARSMEAAAPRRGVALRLRAARHPLLQAQLRQRGRDVVPLDLDLGGAGALVLTGPNTGGKTVALKTVGLLVLMHQSGLQVPAHPDSELPVFARLVADIGDEQSIEAAESTFSSHLRHVRQALEAPAHGLLALLDEFMAGTDPEEGAALAMAVLRHLVAQQATTLVTTHLGALKLFAHTEPGIANAAMVFDAARGTPLFRLEPGVPGSSNALATAERLGFPPGLVAAAQRERGADSARLETVLRALEAERAGLETARRAAEQAEAEARRLREELAVALAELAQRRAKDLAAARRELQALLESARAQVENTIRDLRASPAGRDDIRTARDALQELAARLPEPEPAPAPPAGPLQPGDTVWIRPLGSEGRLEELLGDRAVVRYGPAAVTVSLQDLELRRRAAEKPAAPGWGGYVVQEATQAAALELDLRGFERAEAVAALDQFLDRAVLQGLPSVRIVHGKGTGVLRRAVQEHLASHPAVAAHRLGEHGEGGAGVTIAELH